MNGELDMLLIWNDRFIDEGNEIKCFNINNFTSNSNCF